MSSRRRADGSATPPHDDENGDTTTHDDEDQDNTHHQNEDHNINPEFIAQTHAGPSFPLVPPPRTTAEQAFP